MDTSNLAPRLVQQVRPAVMVAGGLVLAAIGLGLLTRLGLNSLALVVIGNTLMSLGFGFTFTLTIDLVIGAAPSERAGAASTLAETGAELGGALGLAVLGSLGIAVYRSQVVASMPPGISPEVVQAVQETLGGTVAAAGQLPGPLGSTVLHLAHTAFIQGLHLTAFIGVVVMIGLAILTTCKAFCGTLNNQTRRDNQMKATQQNFILGLWGVRYQVKDVQRSIAFYTQMLGFNLDHQNLPAFGQVSISNLKLILSGPGASGSRPMPEGRQQEPGGWNRIVLQVEDLPARIADLKKKSVNFRNEMEVGPGGKQIQVEDPDGNPIELFEPARQ